MFGLSEVPSQMYLPLSIIHYNPVCSCLIGALIFFCFYLMSCRYDGLIESSVLPKPTHNQIYFLAEYLNSRI